MKFFRVTVDGKQYEVAVEELAAPQAGSAVQEQYAAPAPQKTVAPAVPTPAAPAQKPTAPAPQPQSSSGNTYALKAPMPGVILDIRVSVGAKVTQNQVGVILEAMKMENEICIPVAGKVSSISVSKGASINAGDLIMNIEQ